MQCLSHSFQDSIQAVATVSHAQKQYCKTFRRDKQRKIMYIDQINNKMKNSGRTLSLW